MIKEVLSMMMPGNLAHDIAYEWAEEIAKYFGVHAFLDSSHYVNTDKSSPDSFIKCVYLNVKHVMLYIFPFLRIIKRRIHSVIFPVVLTQDINAPLSVYILMEVPEISECRGVNCLLIFTDVWENSIEFVVKSTKNLKLFYVTSRCVFNRIKTLAPDSNVHYMPLSIADKYYSENFVKYRNKTIDVVQSGRKDTILHEYMLRYVKEHENIDYVYSSSGRGSEYISTLRGHLAPVTSRDDFIKIISSSKVSLVSSPGMYRDFQPHKYGFNFPTPKFYECAVLGCALIGHYPDNQEFTELNMRRYCPNISNYGQFCEELERALSMTPEEIYAQNHDFIMNSLTSKRAEQIQKDIEALRCQNS